MGEVESLISEECIIKLDKYNDARQKAVEEGALATDLFHGTRPFEGPANSIPWIPVKTPSVPISSD